MSLSLWKIKLCIFNNWLSNQHIACINILLKIIININISVVTFLGCHYNPGWYRRKFLDPRIFWANCFDVEFLEIPHTFRGKVYIWIRDVFFGNAFFCNLEEIERLNCTFRELGNNQKSVQFAQFPRQKLPNLHHPHHY